MAAKPLLVTLSIREGLHKPSIIHGLSDVPAYPLDNRDGTFTVTGGGIVIPNAVKGGQVSMIVTGGGVVALTGQKGARATISVTGGGVVQLLVSKGGKVVQPITGGGRVTLQWTTGREYVLSITGGGVVTIAAGITGIQTILEIEFDEGGVGRRRPQQDRLDDWTLTMDDEAIIELYALRKTR